MKRRKVIKDASRLESQKVVVPQALRQVPLESPHRIATAHLHDMLSPSIQHAQPFLSEIARAASVRRKLGHATARVQTCEALHFVATGAERA